MSGTGNITTRDVRMQVAGYRISDVLGDGASGIVFSALDPSGRAVALKVLKPELALSAKEQRRFVDEAARMRRVRHPSLVELLDAGELPDGGAYIAMARVPGQTLVQRLATAPLRFDVTLTLFEQLTEALGVLHSQGFVHRDVKPENIFIVEGDQRAILLDLGIARDMSSDPSTTTRAGMIRGTPAYMAPERFFGKPATPQSDIYELGVVLYYTLVGSLPWSSIDNPTERMRPMMPAEHGVVLPPRLSTTLMRALSADAGQRPANAAEFGAAIADALSPESLQFISGHRTARSSGEQYGTRTATVPMAIPPSAPALAPSGPHPPPAAHAAPPHVPPHVAPAHLAPPNSWAATGPAELHATTTRIPGKRSGMGAGVALAMLLGVAVLVAGAFAMRSMLAGARPPPGTADDDQARPVGDVEGRATRDDFAQFDAAELPSPLPPVPTERLTRMPGAALACVDLIKYVCSVDVVKVRNDRCVRLGKLMDTFRNKSAAELALLDDGCERRLQSLRRKAAR